MSLSQPGNSPDSYTVHKYCEKLLGICLSSLSPPPPTRPFPFPLSSSPGHKAQGQVSILQSATLPNCTLIMHSTNPVWAAVAAPWLIVF